MPSPAKITRPHLFASAAVRDAGYTGTPSRPKQREKVLNKPYSY